jgi:hypothetical protein
MAPNDHAAHALEPARTTAVAIELSTVGWRAGNDLPYEDWLRHGARLGVAARSAGWWLGDWLRYGTAHYGAKYTAAVRVTGYDRQTLMNMVYVASRFEPHRRREHLSFSHHAELAALDACEQEWWLDHASAHKLSVRDLREELGAGRGSSTLDAYANQPLALERRTRSRRAAASNAPTRIATCPHCGERFAV